MHAYEILRWFSLLHWALWTHGVFRWNLALVRRGDRGEIVNIILYPDEPPLSSETIITLKHLPSYILVKMQRTCATQLDGLSEVSCWGCNMQLPDQSSYYWRQICYMECSSLSVSNDTSIHFYWLLIARTNTSLCHHRHCYTTNGWARLIQFVCCAVLKFGEGDHSITAWFW